jgi:hypothetical protein
MSLIGSSVLFKFGELEHLRALRQGIVYTSPWNYFSNAENVAERDPNEGTHAWFNPTQTTIQIAGRKFTKEGGTLSASIKFPDTQTKVFCASEACRENCSVAGPIFEERMTRHGQHLLVITGVKHFCEQLTAALTILQDKKVIERFEARRVTYFDENTYDGEVGPFQKASRFAFEKEWRLMVRSVVAENVSFKLDIGSIESDSTLMATKDFKNKIEHRSGDLIDLEF